MAAQEKASNQKTPAVETAGSKEKPKKKRSKKQGKKKSAPKRSKEEMSEKALILEQMRAVVHVFEALGVNLDRVELVRLTDITFVSPEEEKKYLWVDEELGKDLPEVKSYKDGFQMDFDTFQHRAPSRMYGAEIQPLTYHWTPQVGKSYPVLFGTIHRHKIKTRTGEIEKVYCKVLPPDLSGEDFQQISSKPERIVTPFYPCMRFNRRKKEKELQARAIHPSGKHVILLTNDPEKWATGEHVECLAKERMSNIFASPIGFYGEDAEYFDQDQEQAAIDELERALAIRPDDDGPELAPGEYEHHYKVRNAWDDLAQFGVNRGMSLRELKRIKEDKVNELHEDKLIGAYADANMKPDQDQLDERRSEQDRMRKAFDAAIADIQKDTNF